MTEKLTKLNQQKEREDQDKKALRENLLQRLKDDAAQKLKEPPKQDENPFLWKDFQLENLRD